MKIMFFLLVLLFNIGGMSFVTSSDQFYLAKTKDQLWELFWVDYFDEMNLDSSKWSKIPPNSSNWGKYLADDSSCYKFKDGKLELIGKLNSSNSLDSKPYQTGGIYTKNKFSFTYGKVEVSAKVENGQGVWPAIWMKPETNKYGSYPRNGEIDIMEHLNFDTLVYQTIHTYYTLTLGNNSNPINSTTVDIDTTKFNIYGVEWFPNKIVFTVNGIESFKYPKIPQLSDSLQWPFDQPFYILIDQQLGGGWVGEIDDSHLPSRFIVDYIKVYKLIE